MRNETNKPQLSQLVGTYFIKLANLSALIHQAYAGSDATDINFFIDVYSIKKTILRSDFITSSELFQRHWSSCELLYHRFK